jgi:3'-5' exoribonuclease
MPKQFIKDLKVGDRVASVFILKKKDLQKTKENKPYLRLTVADKTGSIEGVMWEYAETADANIDNGMPVFVKGLVSSYKENMQLKVDEARPATSEEYKLDDIIRAISDIEGLYSKVKKYLDAISDKWVALLVKSFVEDKDFIERFKKSPGARSWHNAYIGGLMEHTWEVMYIVDKTCDIYPLAIRDIAIAGAFFHDIGKTVELDPSTFEYTIEGGLIGHLPLGFEILSKRMASIEGFPQDLATHLRHIILSHHGEYEQQSPVLPKTLEATIVYHADELTSQANAVKEIIEAQSKGPRDWSNYVTIKSRQYFLRKPDSSRKQ